MDTKSSTERTHSIKEKEHDKQRGFAVLHRKRFQRYKLTGRAFSHPSGSLRLMSDLNSAASVGYFFS
jgi:hypothetical protein